MTADAAQLISMLNPPAYIQPAAEELPAWPIFGRVSSGCLLLIDYFDERAIRPGYVIVRIEDRAKASFDTVNNFSGLMEDIRQGFGRTFSRLPAVFGVSRQTLYNWLNGEIPKERHQARIWQLAEAARTFTEASFIPTAASLSRTLSRGKSFLELISDGANGREAATKLVVLTQQSLASRARVDAAVAKTKPVSNSHLAFAAPALDEDAS